MLGVVDFVTVTGTICRPCAALLIIQIVGFDFIFMEPIALVITRGFENSGHLRFIVRHLRLSSEALKTPINRILRLSGSRLIGARRELLANGPVRFWADLRPGGSASGAGLERSHQYYGQRPDGWGASYDCCKAAQVLWLLRNDAHGGSRSSIRRRRYCCWASVNVRQLNRYCFAAPGASLALSLEAHPAGLKEE